MIHSLTPVFFPYSCDLILEEDTMEVILAHSLRDTVHCGGEGMAIGAWGGRSEREMLVLSSHSPFYSF